MRPRRRLPFAVDWRGEERQQRQRRRLRLLQVLPLAADDSRLSRRDVTRPGHVVSALAAEIERELNKRRL